MTREKKIIAIIAFVSLTIISTIFSFLENRSGKKENVPKENKKIIAETQLEDERKEVQNPGNITISELADQIEKSQEEIPADIEWAVSEGSVPALEIEPELEGGTWRLLEISNIECLDVLLPLNGQQHILQDLNDFFEENNISENKVVILPESIVNEEKYLEFEFSIENFEKSVIATYFHQADIFVFEWK